MKSEITKLIEKYNREKSKRYNEEATKKDFILPLFKALGWDVENSNEVTPEDKVSTKRVDYAFKIDGISKFYLEAKPLDENLDKYREQNSIKTTFAQQAVNYAYYKGCIWAILTNFSEIRIYDAWTRDTVSGFRFAIRIYNFVNDFDNGLYLLSKEAFKQGELDKKYSTKSRKKPITEQLLSDFTKFRAILSKDVYALNKSKDLKEEELDEAIQRLFDRLIFIRNCEDRGLEPPNLLALLRQWKESRKGTLISKLRELFEQYNKYYDSKIFGEHEGDKHLCDQIDISDNVLISILDGLYTTEDKSIQYDFSLLDADVLGNIYEQYLGHILKKTEKRTKLTESKAKRKEEGIYYTPSYIVDYIVRNTVGELIKNKKIDVSKIKVLDPACGSGSFLIKTFDVLNEYHSKKEGYSQNKLDMSGTGTTYSTKFSILMYNIFGVDLDKQAVDIAQLNLLLKVAEKKKRLPILRQNIKNGNSLIDDPNIAGDKAFKWNEEFAKIMDNGGFDVVVGNPPWGAELNNAYGYLVNKFSDVSVEEVDSYKMFIKQGLKLTKNDGYFSFIVPSTLLYSIRYRDVRKLLLEHKLESLIDLGDGVFGKSKVTAPCCIFVVKKQNMKPKTSIKCIDTSHLKNNKEKSIAISEQRSILHIKQERFETTPFNCFYLDLDPIKDKILEKMKKGSKLFGDVCESCDAGINYKTIGRGKVRGGAIGEKFLYIGKKENASDIPYLRGSDIWRYGSRFNDNYMRSNFEELINRKNGDVVGFNKKFFSLSEKLLSRQTASHLIATYDNKQFYTNRTLHSHKVRDKFGKDFPLKFVLALFNSELLDFYYQQIKSKRGKGRAMPQVNLSFLRQLPLKVVPKESSDKIVGLVDKILMLNNDLIGFGDKQTEERKRLEDEILAVDIEINNLIYKLYGITEEEKKSIEESLK